MPPSPGPKALYGEAVKAHAALMGQPPVAPETFMDSIAAIETTGQEAIGAKGRGKVTMQVVGEAALAAIGNEETQAVIEPSLNPNQLRLLAGKVVLWTAAAEASPTPVAAGQASRPKPS